MYLSRRNFLDFLKATCATAALPGFSQEVIGIGHQGESLPIVPSDSSNNSIFTRNFREMELRHKDSKPQRFTKTP